MTCVFLRALLVETPFFAIRECKNGKSSLFSLFSGSSLENYLKCRLELSLFFLHLTSEIQLGTEFAKFEEWRRRDSKARKQPVAASSLVDCFLFLKTARELFREDSVNQYAIAQLHNSY